MADACGFVARGAEWTAAACVDAGVVFTVALVELNQQSASTRSGKRVD